MVEQKKKVRCPKCGRRLLDSNICTQSKIYLLEVSKQIGIDYFTKCSKCHTEIGIKKVI